MPTWEHSPADLVRYLLIAKGAGTLPSKFKDWPIQVSQEPSQPDNVITIYDTEGFRFGRIQLTGEHPEHKGIQVRLRSFDHPRGWKKIQAVANLLDMEVYQETVSVPAASGTEPVLYVVQSLTRQSAILPIGRDAENSDRHLFTVNYTVVARPL